MNRSITSFFIKQKNLFWGKNKMNKFNVIFNFFEILYSFFKSFFLNLYKTF